MLSCTKIRRWTTPTNILNFPQYRSILHWYTSTLLQHNCNNILQYYYTKLLYNTTTLHHTTKLTACSTLPITTINHHQISNTTLPHYRTIPYCTTLTKYINWHSYSTTSFMYCMYFTTKLHHNVPWHTNNRLQYKTAISHTHCSKTSPHCIKPHFPFTTLPYIRLYYKTQHTIKLSTSILPYYQYSTLYEHHRPQMLLCTNTKYCTTLYTIPLYSSLPLYCYTIVTLYYTVTIPNCYCITPLLYNITTLHYTTKITDYTILPITTISLTQIIPNSQCYITTFYHIIGLYLTIERWQPSTPTSFMNCAYSTFKINWPLPKYTIPHK